jgi:hypothetical protein
MIITHLHPYLLEAAASRRDLIKRLPLESHTTAVGPVVEGRSPSRVASASAEMISPHDTFATFHPMVCLESGQILLEILLNFIHDRQTEILLSGMARRARID